MARANRRRAELPRLGEHAYPTLWAYARCVDHVPRALDEYPFLADDRPALRILGARCGDAAVLERVLRLDDPELNADLYGAPLGLGDVAVRRVILSRVPQGRPAAGPEDLLPLHPTLRGQLLAEHRATASVLPALRPKVEAADPALIDHALRQLGKKASLSDRLLGGRGLLRHGGAERIGALVEQGVLGATAGRVTAKALASADPDAALTERIDRERGADKLLAKLRRCHGSADTDELLELPYARDWDLIVAEHEREPFPTEVLNRLVEEPDSPARLLALGPVHLRSARVAAALDAEHARASIGAGRDVLGDAPWYRHLDELVTAGLVTGHDLVHHARGAGPILRRLAEAAHRREVPGPIHEAATEAHAEITTLLRTHLDTDPTNWHRVFAALSGCDPTWSPESPGSTIEALFTR
ncbi:hypothetical protein [Embleya sp. AB8]|uniref:hypothetical protein n=1 Tax=Embleya sp. AB8 TaxID=3156304 RepID=UPI003C719F34